MFLRVSFILGNKYFVQRLRSAIAYTLKKPLVFFKDKLSFLIKNILVGK